MAANMAQLHSPRLDSSSAHALWARRQTCATTCFLRSFLYCKPGAYD